MQCLNADVVALFVIGVCVKNIFVGFAPHFILSRSTKKTKQTLYIGGSCESKDKTEMSEPQSSEDEQVREETETEQPERRRRGRPRGSRTGTNRAVVPPERTIAIPALEPTQESDKLPDVHAWPLGGPGARDYIVLHSIDMHSQDRDNVVIVDASVWPPRVSTYDYRVRPIQPRYVTADGRWLCRRSIDVVNAPVQGAYKRLHRRWRVEAEVEGNNVRGDRVQEARAVVPQEQEYVELYASLDALLRGEQPLRSILFPQASTHDFPDHMAVIGTSDGIVAISSVLQFSRGTTHPWWAAPGTNEFKPLTNALPLTRDEARIEGLTRAEREALHRAYPVERPSERTYIVGFVHDQARQQPSDAATLLVWNGRAYAHDEVGNRWHQRYDFQSSDLGMRVPYWSSVLNRDTERVYYVNNQTLRYTLPINANDVAPIEPEDRYAVGRALPARAPRALYTEPFDGYSVAGTASACGTDSGATGRQRGAKKKEPENALGRDGRLRLNDLHSVSSGPEADVLVLQRKPFNTQTVAYVFDATSGKVLALERKKHFGIQLQTVDVAFVRYFPQMHMQVRPRRGIQVPEQNEDDEEEVQENIVGGRVEVRGGFIALARNKLVFVDALNAELSEFLTSLNENGTVSTEQ